MFKKFAALAAAAALSLGVMTGCGASGTTADSTGYSAENPLVLTLAHGLSETHTVHIAMTQFADEVAEKTDGRIQVKIFPNGQLGSENENLEQLQAGVIAMTKVSAPGLATYNDACRNQSFGNGLCCVARTRTGGCRRGSAHPRQ